jgi:hypothetical protein
MDIPEEALLDEEDEEEEDEEKKEQECLLCCDRKANVITQPCNHMVICDQCHRKLGHNSKCLRCNQTVQFIKPKIAPAIIANNVPMCAKCRKEPAAILHPCGHAELCCTCIFDRKVYLEQHADAFSGPDPTGCIVCDRPISCIFTIDMQYFTM